MSFLVRIESLEFGKVWWEIRETEHDIDLLVDSVFDRNPPQHGITYAELDNEAPPERWIKCSVSPTK